MTGRASTYIEEALNFEMPAVRDDNILRIAATRGLKTVLYGDITTLILFPGFWTEYEVSNGPVSDFTEVIFLM